MRIIERFIGVTALVLIIAVLMASTPPSVAAQGENMLYLVEFKATEAKPPTTREQAIELLEKLIVPSLENLAKDGKIHAGGLLAGARAGVFIVGAKSHDEVTELVYALPAWGVWHWKVTPLDSFAHRADLEKKVVQGLRAQKQ
ncbi:MAG: hypothetical protein E2O38_10160 [Proteobacteria bacterium]|jgi:hypothetical protein|nr:MAG: hypothetical protein E2O38_10160 [Pseudomonadota bacterium]